MKTDVHHLGCERQVGTPTPCCCTPRPGGNARAQPPAYRCVPERGRVPRPRTHSRGSWLRAGTPRLPCHSVTFEGNKGEGGWATPGCRPAGRQTGLQGSFLLRGRPGARGTGREGWGSRGQGRETHTPPTALPTRKAKPSRPPLGRQAVCMFTGMTGSMKTQISPLLSTHWDARAPWPGTHGPLGPHPAPHP